MPRLETVLDSTIPPFGHTEVGSGTGNVFAVVVAPSQLRHRRGIQLDLIHTAPEEQHDSMIRILAGADAVSIEGIVMHSPEGIPTSLQVFAAGGRIVFQGVVHEKVTSEHRIQDDPAFAIVGLLQGGPPDLASRHDEILAQ